MAIISVSEFGAGVGSADILDDSILNADINSAAAIAISKLQALTKGDLIGGDGTGGPGILTVGNNGEVLTADSTQATGMKWSTSGSGDLLADGTIPLTADWDVGAFTITGTQFISDIATGTAPLVVASTTVVANLNASLLEGNAASAFALALGADDNYVTDAEKTVIGNTSGTNTGDQTLPVKASAAEVDTGTDDAKFATALALKSSKNVPSVVPGTSGNILESDGTDWQSVAAAGGGAWETISSGQLASAATNLFDTSSISTDYDAFRLTLFVVAANEVNLALRLNNDSGANYDFQYNTINGTTNSGARVEGQTSIDLIDGSQIGNGEAGIVQVYIAKSLTTTKGHLIVTGAGGDNTGGNITTGYGHGSWDNTAAKISRIAVFDSTSTSGCGIGSFWLLEGIKL